MKTRITWPGGLIVAISLGLPTGFVFGVHSPAKALCNGEPPIYFGPGNNTVYDYSDDDPDEMNDWWGEAGQDYLRSLPCSDGVHGGDDNDNVGGGSDVDIVEGDNGSDYLYGGAQDDVIGGFFGRDRLFDQETGDYDFFYGGGNDDYLVDGRDSDGNDEVDGGAGTDNCEWDSGDTHPNCET